MSNTDEALSAYHRGAHPANFQDTKVFASILMGPGADGRRGLARAPLYGADATEVLRTIPSNTIVVVDGDKVTPWDGTGTPTGVLGYKTPADGDFHPARVDFEKHKLLAQALDRIHVPPGLTREAVYAALGPDGIGVL
jgi:hypothetical protein